MLLFIPSPPDVFKLWFGPAPAPLLPLLLFLLLPSAELSDQVLLVDRLVDWVDQVGLAGVNFG